MSRFRWLTLGQALSTLGDILYILALVTTLYRQSGSAAVAALFPLLRVIGMSVGGFGAPLAMGRWRLGSLLAGSLLVQTLGLAVLAAYVQSADWLHVEGLVAMVFVLSVLEGIAGPVRSSLLPRLVTRERLLKANGTLGAVIETCSLTGWTVGAIVLSRIGAAPSLWSAAAMLLCAYAAARAIGNPDVEAGGVAPASGESAATSDTGSKSLLTGWRILLRRPPLRVLLWMEVWEGLFASAFAGALLLVFAQEQLHVGETWWGWMNGAFCAGLIAANAGIGRWLGDAQRKLGALMLAGSAGMAVGVWAFAFTAQPGWALAIMLVIGVAEASRALAGRTLLQLAATQAEQPSVFAAHGTLIPALYGVSLLLTGWLADRYGIQLIYWLAGTGYFAAFLGAFRGRRTLREAAGERLGA